MQAKELFGVLVRAAGLFFLVSAFFDGTYAILKAFGIYTQNSKPVVQDTFGAIVWLVAGVIFFFGADKITNAAYKAEISN